MGWYPLKKIVDQPWPFMDRSFPGTPATNRAAVTVRGMAVAGVHGRILAIVRQPAERDTSYWTRRHEKQFRAYVQHVILGAERGNGIPIGYARVTWDIAHPFPPRWQFWKHGDHS